MKTIDDAIRGVLCEMLPLDSFEVHRVEEDHAIVLLDPARHTLMADGIAARLLHRFDKGSFTVALPVNRNIGGVTA